VSVKRAARGQTATTRRYPDRSRARARVK